MHSESNKNPKTDSIQILKIPRLSLFLGLLVLIGLGVYVYFHVGDAKRFLSLISNAEPQWLLLVIVLQIATYMSVGVIWFHITHTSKYNVSFGSLARLSVEKLSVDQFIPALGMSGNLIVYKAMKRLKIPRKLALEAILINILAHYMAYGLVAITAMLALWYFYHITPILLLLVGIFSIILIAVPFVVLWLIAHKDKKLPGWLLKFKIAERAHKVIKSVSPKLIYAPKTLVFASLFNLLIFLLDSGTLWAALRSAGISVSFLTAFIALVIASIAATLSALPGGLGGFEAGSIAMLTLTGVPIEGALAGTFLLRGFTLWLPLIPGLFFARHDFIMKL
jgi:uncharacterized protein (TIRG00374 family)